MDFDQQLKKNKKTIIDKWFHAVISTYPEETARILVKSKNKFDNPVAVATQECIEDTFNLLLENRDLTEQTEMDKIESALDAVVRIRAVQTMFTAEKAVGFVFRLKDIVKEETGTWNESFDSRVDQIALAAFNRFMKCREDIFLLKATESKRRIHRAFERAGLVEELSEEDLLGSRKS
ncbi:MAG: RsbRD N-terminal domain-containing protein [Thermodesulfobacteriota bacterium]|nr:RsbRD N-terminal domain-containing protein [Thermodesulfobacteriota bacterium]